MTQRGTRRSRNSSPPSRFSIGLADVTLAILATVVLGSSFLVLADDHAPTGNSGDRPDPPDLTTTADRRLSGLTVAVLGDSYSQGAGASSPTNGWTQVFAQATGAEVAVYGAGGIGYTSGDDRGAGAFGTHVPEIVSSRPDVVIVAGSYNDADAPEAVASRALEALARITTELPRARLLVVGPFWYDGSPPEAVRKARDGVRAAAETIDAQFVDPIAENWVTEANVSEMVAGDGEHPSDAGHANIAARIAGALDPG